MTINLLTNDEEDMVTSVVGVLSDTKWMSLVCASAHLFDKIFRFPGCFGGSSLFTLVALSLSVFVFCGSIYISCL